MLLSWTDETGQEERVFLSDTTCVRAEFDSSIRSPRDHARLERLMIAASSNAGLSISAAINDRSGTRIPTEQAVQSSPPSGSDVVEP